MPGIECGLATTRLSGVEDHFTAGALEYLHCGHAGGGSELVDQATCKEGHTHGSKNSPKNRVWDRISPFAAELLPWFAQLVLDPGPSGLNEVVRLFQPELPSYPSDGVFMATPPHVPLGSVDIRYATTAVDRDEVFKLRDRVFGNAGTAELAGLTRSNGRLIEPADCGAQLLSAFDDQGRALAAIRREPLTRVLEANACHEPLQRLAETLKADLARVTVSSRFIIDPASVGGNLALRLFASLLRIGMQEGVSHDFRLCGESRAQWRLRLGYVSGETQLLDADGSPRQVLWLPIAGRKPSERSVVRLVRKSVRAA